MDITQQYFTCKKCGESKIWGEMVKNKRCKDNIRKLCNQCVSAISYEYKKAHPEQIANNKEATRKWRELNPDKVRKLRKRWKKRNKSKVRKEKRRACANLTDYYIRTTLKNRIPIEQIAQNPELIEIQRIIIQTKRLCKT